ncbi:MAG: STAS domain-containing protein, partial [Acidobacteriota bacterium]|nr:STAS domain-containing protein [Acidobacteriota bacterium]
MELNISANKEGNSVVLDLNGDLVIGETCTKLRQTVREWLDQDVRDITFDLADVRRLDSSGIGEMIATLIAVNRADGSLVLLRPNDHVYKLLAISELPGI